MIKGKNLEYIIRGWDNTIILLGGTQVRKTTLIQNLVKNTYVFKLNGDDPQTRLELSNVNFNFFFRI